MAYQQNQPINTYGVTPDIEVSDEMEFGAGNQVVSMKTIVLRHIKKISDLSCKEFTGGYWQKKPIRTPGGVMFIEEYHEDVRQAYCNAVDFLIDILIPESDEAFKKYIEYNESIENEEEDIGKKLLKKRKTFREINMMFVRNNYFQTIGIENQ